MVRGRECVAGYEKMKTRVVRGGQMAGRNLGMKGGMARSS